MNVLIESKASPEYSAQEKFMVVGFVLLLLLLPIVILLTLREDHRIQVTQNSQQLSRGGTDTFRIESLNDLTTADQVSTQGRETIVDFNFAEGDKLDLSMLLNQLGTNQTSFPTLQNTIQIDTSDPGASKSLMQIRDGANTYELLVDNAASSSSSGAFDELDSQSLLGLSAANSTSASWMDVVNVASTAGFQGLTGETALTPGSDGWTLKVMTPGVQVQVDSETRQVQFIKDGQVAEANVQITTGDGTTHEISNVDKITW